MSSLSTLLTVLACLAVAAEDICMENVYIMDKYCVNRGTLLDAPTVVTLESPDLHSVHCLVDVPNCFKSGYELLAENPVAGGPKYCRAFQFEEAGNQLVISTARAAGSTALGCRTCTGTGAATQKRGFRATVIGTSTGQGVAGLPPTLIVTSMVVNGTCPQAPTAITTAMTCITEAGGDVPFIAAHGTCMLLGWGLLLPSGVIAAKTLRHKGPVWFKLHRGVQVTGLLLATIGWIIALSRFNVFIAGGAKLSLIHGSLGMVVMSLGLLQPLNAFFRPHPSKPEDSAGMKTKRRGWEILHKGSGYLAVLLGLITVGLGIGIAAMLAFQVIYGLFLLLLLGFLLWAILDGRINKAAQVATESADSRGG